MTVVVGARWFGKAALPPNQSRHETPSYPRKVRSRGEVDGKKTPKADRPAGGVRFRPKDEGGIGCDSLRMIRTRTVVQARRGSIPARPKRTLTAANFFKTTANFVTSLPVLLRGVTPPKDLCCAAREDFPRRDLGQRRPLLQVGVIPIGRWTRA